MDRKTASRTIGAVAFWAVILLSLPLVAGFFGQLHPAFDSFAHFRVHLAILLALAALPLLATRSFRLHGLLGTTLGCAAILTVTSTSFLPGPGPVQASYQPKDELSPVYRLMQLNLRFDNPEPGKVLSLVGRVRPDVVTLNEVSEMWSEKLALLSGAYPHRIVCTMDNRAGGVAILSLRPFAEGTQANASTAEPSRPPPSISAAGSSRSAHSTSIGLGRSISPRRSMTLRRCSLRWARRPYWPETSTLRRGAPPRTALRKLPA